MKIFRIKIFGKKVEIILEYEDLLIYKSLKDQFSFYESFNENEKSDLAIRICKNFEHHLIHQKNPSIHSEIENGFITEYKTHRTAFFKKENKLYIELMLKTAGNRILSSLRKFNNIEYATREERTAGIIFETILIPTIFFEDDKFILHSAGFAESSKGTFIGGTGGGGKTSLEIEMCLNQNMKFLNDDIGVISSSGEVLPNLNHPKIYGYNLKGNKKLNEILLRNKTVFDRLQWTIKSKFFGLSKVRRRLKVDNYRLTNQKISLDRYYILSKENIDDLILEEIPPETAKIMSLNIILSEYSEFLNHVLWHEFNKLSKNEKPIITVDEIKANWQKVASDVFSRTKNYMIRIPLKIKHSDFIEKAVKLITKAD